ncbi:MAG: alpha/beta hydrolase, partial [Gammaproteobacteria bacterium]
CGLRYPQPLAGIIALSACLPTVSRLQTERAVANDATPIFMAHGRYDPVVPVAAARQICQILQGLHYSVAWQEYPMPHSVSGEEISAIAVFIDTLLR